MSKAEPAFDQVLAASLVGPFTAIARAMSNNFGVRVIPNGFRCCTDSENVIYIPFAADHLGPDQRLHLNGMLDHEVCHVAEEVEHKAAGRPGYATVAKMAKNKTVRLLLNVVEDVRIEKKWMKQYPGVAENLQGMHKQIIDLNKASFAKKAPNFWDAFGVAFFLKARGFDDLGWLGEKALKALAEVEDELERTDSLEWVQDSFEIAERVYNKINRDAEETLERARKPKKDKKPKEKKGKTKKVEDEAIEMPKGEPSEDGEAGDEGDADESDKETEPKPSDEKGKDKGEDDEDLDADDDEGGAGSDDDEDLDADEDDGAKADDDSPGTDDSDDESEDEGDADEDADDSETDDDEPSDAGDDESDEDMDDDEDGSEAGKGKPSDGDDEAAPDAGSPEGGDESDDEEDEPSKEDIERAKAVLSEPSTMEDLTEALKDVLEKVAREDARKHKLYIPDPEMRKKDRWFKPTGGTLDNYLRAKEQVNQQIGAIRAKQLAYIQTITRKRMITGQDAGILDAASLATVRTGSVDVFADIKKGIALDTAIEVLLDLSGSMGGGDDPSSCAFYCKRITIALTEAWEPLRIPNEFIGFTNNWTRGGGYGSVGTGDPDCVRRVPFDFYVFKAWGERLKNCRERFTHIRGYGDNADGEAVWAAAQRLAMRPEKRKMLVVISDGLPCHGAISIEALEKHLRETVRRITRAGIEVLGVGAGTDAPMKFYNKDTGAKNLIINDLNTMAPRLFKTLRESIMP